MAVKVIDKGFYYELQNEDTGEFLCTCDRNELTETVRELEGQ